MESSNYREVDIKNIYNSKNDYFFLSNTIFGCVKETSQGDISFMHPNHTLS